MSWRRVSRSRLLRDPISLILSWIRFAQLSVKLTRQPSRDCRLCGAPRVEFDLTRFLKVRAHHARCTALSRCRAAGRRFPASVCICTSQVKLGSRSATRCVRVRCLSTCAIAPTANVGPARSFSMGMPVARESFAVVIGTPERVDCAAPSGSQTVHSHCPVCRIRTHSEPQAYPGSINVRPGTLDDTSGVEPVAQIWTRSAQLWALMPGLPKYATQPDFPAMLAAFAKIWPP